MKNWSCYEWPVLYIVSMRSVNKLKKDYCWYTYFDQKDGKPELFLNQLTSKSLGLLFFIEYSVKYLYAVQKK